MAPYSVSKVTSCRREKSFTQISMQCDDQKTICQGVKPIVLETNTQNPPWTPKVMPFSIVKIEIRMIVSPFELTTMSGRRVRETLYPPQPFGINKVVIAGYANA